jgi:hypothetical protein
MQILSYFFKKPQTGDKGSVFWPAMEDNFQQLNDHNHDGVNSSTLSVYAITAIKQSLLAANWVATSGGTYRQLVTMPGVTTLDSHFVVFKDTSSQTRQLFLETEKVGANTYYVYINDNSLNITAYYLR